MLEKPELKDEEIIRYIQTENGLSAGKIINILATWASNRLSHH